MPRRRDRVLVVLDTNVVVRALKDPNGRSASARTYRLWLQRKLQIVVTEEIRSEYLEVLDRLGLAQPLIERFARRLDVRQTVTHVRLGAHLRICRDPDDDLMLSAAQGGRAQFLITNDSDLLDIPMEDRQGLRFEILSPVQFMAEWDAERIGAP